MAASLWPVVLTPKPGESFPGYLHRAAAFNGVDERTLLKRFHLRHSDHGGSRTQSSLPPLWFGYAIPRSSQLEVARALGLDPEQVAGMHLADFLPDLASNAVNQVPDRRTHRLATIAFGVLSGTRLCWWCYQEDGVVQLRWKLASHFGCLRHRCLLTSKCDVCRVPLPARSTRVRMHPGTPCWAHARADQPVHQPGGLDAAPETLEALRQLNALRAEGVLRRPSDVYRQVTSEFFKVGLRFSEGFARRSPSLDQSVEDRARRLGLRAEGFGMDYEPHPRADSPLYALLLPEVVR